MVPQHRSTKTVSNYSEGDDASLFDFSWNTGQVTEAEKAQAERGAASRGTIGAKRDRCKNGKPCGAACIYYQKDCVLDLPVTVSRDIAKARNFIQKLVTSGQMGEEEGYKAFMDITGLGRMRNLDADLSKGKVTAAQQRELSTAVKGSKFEARFKGLRESIRQIREESPDKETAKKRTIETIALAVKQAQGKRPARIEDLSPEVIAALKDPKNQEHFRKFQEVFDKVKAGQFKTEEEFSKAMQEATAFYYKQEVTPGMVNLFRNAVSPENLNGLASKGVAAGNEAPFWGSAMPGRNAMLQPMPTSGDQRAIQEMVRRGNENEIIAKYLASRGFDIYSGLPLFLKDADLEHIIPEQAAGRWANTGANRALTMSKINQLKREDDFQKTLYASNEKSPMWRAPKEGVRKGALIEEVRAGQKSAAEVMALVGSLPKSVMSGADVKEINAAIVSHLTGTPQSVVIGRTGGSKNNTQGWYLFGGKEASGWSPTQTTALGQKMAEKLAQWEGQGAAGTQKIATLVNIINQIRSEVASVNTEVFNGERMSDIGFKNNAAAKQYVQNHISNVMQSRMPLLEEALNQ